MLAINNIEVKYSDIILVLRGVSLEVPDEEIVSLMGNNGAGKTTTLKAISGMLATELGKVTEGSIMFNGKRIENGDAEVTVGLGIAQVMEGRRTLEHLTVEENLRVGGYKVSGDAKKNLERVYGYFPRLRDVRNSTAGYCSGGEQQMLVIGRGLMARPTLMLLDEPSLGLAPLLVEEIFGILKSINQGAKTALLLVEQNALAALSLANYGYVMENGRVVLDGAAEKLKNNEDIKEFYLGLNEVGKRKSYREVKHYRRRKRWLG